MLRLFGADDRGFVSMYALGLLIIFLSFATLLSSTVLSFFKASQLSTLQDVCILHYVQQHASQEAHKMDVVDGETIKQEITDTTAEDSDHSEEEPPFERFTIQCPKAPVNITYENEQYDALYEEKGLMITLTIETAEGDVMSFAYNSEDIPQ